MAELSLVPEPIMEVMGILPFDSPESLLEKDAEKFIEEEDDSVEPIDVLEFENSPRPPIEFSTMIFNSGPRESSRLQLIFNYDFPR